MCVFVFVRARVHTHGHAFVYFCGKRHPYVKLCLGLVWPWVGNWSPLSFSFSLSNEGVRPGNYCGLSWFYDFSRNLYAAELCSSLLLLFEAGFGHLHIFSSVCFILYSTSKTWFFPECDLRLLYPNHLGTLLKCRFLGPSTDFLKWSLRGWVLEIHIFNLCVPV